MRELNLNEITEILDEQARQAEYLDMSFNERLQIIVDHVYLEKFNNKVKRLMNSAKFRISNAEISDVHYIRRGLDKSLLMSLSTAQFLDNNINVIFHGFTGSGKSYLVLLLEDKHALVVSEPGIFDYLIY